tara:strand:- start:124 stop:516 length:393 start_codon:yes stop_codon:yes gene_type:complete
MIQQVLTFASDINVSLQVGDIIYYSPTASTGQFNTIDNANTIVTFGICTAIYNDGNTNLNVAPYSIFVLYDNSNPATPPPVISDYVMFSKNKEVESTSLKGYFAKIELENWSDEKIELFSIGSEVSESSK